jgi:hypothetical protein
MNFVKFLIVAALICFIAAVGFNVVTINNLDLDEGFFEKNGISLTMELASRLGTVQTLGIIGDILNTNDTASVLQDNRILRELANVLFDWYAPIKWSPVLSASKEIGWLFLQNRLRG